MEPQIVSECRRFRIAEVTIFLRVWLELPGRHRPLPPRRSQQTGRPRSRRRPWPCRTRNRGGRWLLSWIPRLRSRTFLALRLDPWGLAWFLRRAAAARSAQDTRSLALLAGLPPRCRLARYTNIRVAASSRCAREAPARTVVAFFSVTSKAMGHVSAPGRGINQKEMYGLYHLLRQFCTRHPDVLPRARVLMDVDKQSVVEVFNRGRAKNR